MDIYSDKSIIIPTLRRKINQLQSKGAIVQAQPLGLMRVALEEQKNSDSGLFLHVWMPELPIQEGGPFIHTHVFHLTSRVLLGNLTDVSYKSILDSQGNYQLVSGKCAQDYCLLTDVLTRSQMEITRTLKLSEGEIYEIHKGNFHTTLIPASSTTMTLIRKSDVDDADPILAIPYGLKIAKTPFMRNQLDQDFAWRKIDALLCAALDSARVI